MDFGKRYRVGNYWVLKFSKVLRKADIEALRMQMGIDKERWKELRRSSMPFMKVEAVSGLWAIEFSCYTTVYHLLDQMVGEGGKENEMILYHMFNMWFMDTTVAGDDAYQHDKAEAWKAFMGRVKAPGMSDEEDAAVLKELADDEKALADIVEMKDEISKMEDGGQGD